MPTADRPTVPPYFFCTWGYLPSIHQKIGQMNLKTTSGMNRKSLKPSQAFSTASTWAVLIS